MGALIKQLITNIKDITDNSTIIGGDFHTPLKWMGHIIHIENEQGNSGFE